MSLLNELRKALILQKILFKCVVWAWLTHVVHRSVRPLPRSSIETFEYEIKC